MSRGEDNIAKVEEEDEKVKYRKKKNKIKENRVE